ncbi:MAG: hypothetical protein ACLFVJ_04620 [Persicimonas sp.]
MPRFACISLVALALAVLVGSAGCTVGYRYHHLNSTLANDTGASAQVDGSGHTVEMGIVLDFRYVRLISAYLFPTYEFDVDDNLGGSGYHYSQQETRGFRLDVPLLSVWNEEGGLDYPGTMVHRKSVELWGSVSGRPETIPLWWADLGMVYYHHNGVALRAFGGWGGAPFDGNTSRMGAERTQFEFWETTANGYTAGFEITLASGEHALDFVKFFVEQQEEAGKPPR